MSISRPNALLSQPLDTKCAKCAAFGMFPATKPTTVSAPSAEWISVKQIGIGSWLPWFPLASGFTQIFWPSLSVCDPSHRATLKPYLHSSSSRLVGTRFCMQRLWAKSAKREEIKRINQRVSTRSRTMSKISEKKKIITDPKISGQDQKRWKGQSERLQVVRPGDLPCTSGFGRRYAPRPSTSAVWSLGEVNPGCKRYVRNTTKEYKRAIYDIYIYDILSFILIILRLKCKYLQLSQYKQSKYDQICFPLLRHILHIAAELYIMYIDKNVSVCQVDAASLQATKCRGLFGIASA